MKEKKSEIYFHVGLGKTGSTYLQKSVFPFLKSIWYIPTNKYKKIHRIIAGSDKTKTLTSREFDIQLESELALFTHHFPDPKIIMVLREPSEWAASHYKRLVKNGYTGSFQDFISLDSRTTFWALEELDFYQKIKVIQQYSKAEYLVLFYDELSTSPKTFVDRIAHFTGTQIDFSQISIEKVHRSYSDQQLLFLKKINRRFSFRLQTDYKSGILNWFLFRPWWALYHLILYYAKITRQSSSETLIPEKDLEAIKKHFAQDWIKLKQQYS